MMKVNKRSTQHRTAGRGFSWDQNSKSKIDEHRVVQRAMAKHPVFNPTKQASSIRYPDNHVENQSVSIPRIQEPSIEDSKTAVEEQKELSQELQESGFLSHSEENRSEQISPIVVHESATSSNSAIRPHEFNIREENGIFTSSLEVSSQTAQEITHMKVHLTLQRTLSVSVNYNGTHFVINSNRRGSLMMAVMQLRMYNALFTASGLSNNHPNDLRNIEFNETLDYKGERKCSICLEDILVGHIIRRTPCMHLFHVDCIQNWLSNKPTCPIDKQLLRY